MKPTKTKISFKGSVEVPQDVVTEQATLALLEVENVSTASVGITESMLSVLPRLNKHFSKETLAVIQKAVENYPDKVDKIILYANTVDESQLPLIYSVPTF